MAYINGKEILFSPTIIADDIKYNEGYNKGYAEGYEKGKAEGGVQVATVEMDSKKFLVLVTEGLTWREWVDSEYNQLGAYVNEYNIVVYSDDRAIRGGEWQLSVGADAAIEAGATYWVW